MKRVIFLLLLIPLFFACKDTPSESSSEKKDSPVAACVDNSVQPQGADVYVCKNGEWILDFTCKRGTVWDPVYGACVDTSQ